MQVDILYGPSNTIAKITLQQGEQVSAEGGSMVAMSSGLTIETTTHQKGQGGIGKALKRMIGGESFFINHYESERDGVQLYLAPSLSGDIISHELNGATIIVQAGSYLGHSGDIKLDMSWQGFSSFIMKEGLFWLKISGTGTVILNSFGAIYPVQVANGKDHIVDTGHIVAFDENLKFNVTKVGEKWIDSFLGGEGFVAKFTGDGTLWCQSHNAPNFGRAVAAKLKPDQ